MSMLTICAPDNLCGAGSFYNDCPIEIQSLDSAWGARHGLHPDLLRRVAWPGSGRIFPLRDEAIAVEARSFAREHAWLGGIDFGYDHPVRRADLPAGGRVTCPSRSGATREGEKTGDNPT